MPAISLAQAESRLTDYLAAEAAVLGGQSYSIAGRQMTRADLGAIQQGIAIWNGRVKDLAARSSGVRRAISPRIR